MQAKEIKVIEAVDEKLLAAKSKAKEAAKALLTSNPAAPAAMDILEAVDAIDAARRKLAEAVR
jgi:hypothetical protein